MSRCIICVVYQAVVHVLTTSSCTMNCSKQNRICNIWSFFGVFDKLLPEVKQKILLFTKVVGDAGIVYQNLHA